MLLILLLMLCAVSADADAADAVTADAADIVAADAADAFAVDAACTCSMPYAMALPCSVASHLHGLIARVITPHTVRYLHTYTHHAHIPISSPRAFRGCVEPCQPILKPYPGARVDYGTTD